MMSKNIFDTKNNWQFFFYMQQRVKSKQELDKIKLVYIFTRFDFKTRRKK
jgi:hypothetical protein